MLYQSAGRRDNHFRVFTQRCNLMFISFTTDDNATLDRREFREFLEGLYRLECKFPCRQKNQSSRTVARSVHSKHVIQHRQQERGSFCHCRFLADTMDIPSFKNCRYGAALNLGSLAEAQCIERLETAVCVKVNPVTMSGSGPFLVSSMRDMPSYPVSGCLPCHSRHKN